MEMEMKALVRMRVTNPLTPAITISCWTNPGEPQTTPPRMLLVTVVSSEGLVPSLLPWETHPDAWEVREERNVWHARSTVARRWSSPDTRRSGHPKGVWKLEKQLLFVQISSHSSESVYGNYYVYKFVKPTACHMAYCAGKIRCTWSFRKIWG